jgi:hypothetical protein
MVFNNSENSCNLKEYTIFRDVTSCSLVHFYRRFGGTCLHLQSTLFAAWCLLSVPPSSILKMETVNSSEMPFRFYQTAGRHIQQCDTIHGHLRDNLQSHTITVYKGQDYKRGGNAEVLGQLSRLCCCYAYMNCSLKFTRHVTRCVQKVSNLIFSRVNH